VIPELHSRVESTGENFPSSSSLMGPLAPQFQNLHFSWYCIAFSTSSKIESQFYRFCDVCALLCSTNWFKYYIQLFSSMGSTAPQEKQNNVLQRVFKGILMKIEWSSFQETYIVNFPRDFAPSSTFINRSASIVLCCLLARLAVSASSFRNSKLSDSSSLFAFRRLVLKIIQVHSPTVSASF